MISWVKNLGLLLATVVVCLLFAEAVLRTLPVKDAVMIEPVSSEARVPHLKPNRNITFSSGWNFTILNERRINNLGFADDQDYDKDSSAPLLAVVGDSYVESLMVPYTESVQGRLSAYASTRARVYSFALAESPLSTYLVFAEHARDLFRPQGAVFVIISNDFDESWVRFKRPARRQRLTFFVENDDGNVGLETIPYEVSPAKRILRKSALARYLYLNVGIQRTSENIAKLLRGDKRPVFVSNKLAKSDPERLAASIRAVDIFLARLPESSGLSQDRIAFVIDGIRQQIYGEISDEIAEASFFSKMRKYFITAARAQGYEVIDMHPVFKDHYRQHTQRFEFPTDNHWNGLGHGVAASAVRGSRVFSDFDLERANEPDRDLGLQNTDSTLTDSGSDPN